MKKHNNEKILFEKINLKGLSNKIYEPNWFQITSTEKEINMDYSSNKTFGSD